MIPILFNETATDFTTFGSGVLRECTSCEVTEERRFEIFAVVYIKEGIEFRLELFAF